MIDIAPTRKRCKWCEYGQSNPLAIEPRWRFTCGHPEQNWRRRIDFWPKTGCPAFSREVGADDDLIQKTDIDREGFFQ